MKRRTFFQALLGAAVAPKTMLAKPTPAAYFGGRVDGFYYNSVKLSAGLPNATVYKLFCNSMYGKFGK